MKKKPFWKVNRGHFSVHFLLSLPPADELITEQSKDCRLKSPPGRSGLRYSAKQLKTRVDFCKKKNLLLIEFIIGLWIDCVQWYWKWQECKNFKNLWVVMPNSRQMEIVSIKWIYSHWIRSDRYHLIRDQTGLLL